MGPHSEDFILGGRIRLRQPTNGYRAPIDPVLLAAAVPARAGDRVLDLGCGVGTAGLCLAARVADVVVVGIEREPSTVRLAEATLADNAVAGRVSIVEGDVRALPNPVARCQFDHTLLNPPFGRSGQERPPVDPVRAAAMMADDTSLTAWLDCAAARTRPGGTVVAIHRADRLAELLAAVSSAFGDLVVFPLWPRAGVAAKRILVGGCRASKAPLRLLPGLVLHDVDGSYTVAAEAVLREAAPLDLWPRRSPPRHRTA